MLPALRYATMALGLATAQQACSEVSQVADDAFEIRHHAAVSKDAAAAFAATTAVARWWHPDHTWSGDATHLSLDARAGGCFCESWEDGSVEHLRVLYVQPDRLLRLGGALGPLQGMNLLGTMAFRYSEREDGGTDVDVSYRVSGDSLHRLRDLAPVVDQVLGLQFARLHRFIESGRPDAPTNAEAPASPEPADAAAVDS